MTIDVPHLLVLLGIVGFCGWYLHDTRGASTNVQNLLLIEPAAILAFVMALFVLREVVTIAPVADMPPRREHLSSSTMFRILGSMATLGCYVGIMPYCGFDIGTALYVYASLLVLGERRIAVLVATPIAFSVVTIFIFKQVVSIPLPLFFG